MRKLSLIISCGIVSAQVLAQSTEVLNANNYLKYNELDKAKEAIDKASVHEKTKDNAKTWYYRGLVYQSINESDNSNFKALDNNALAESYRAFKHCLELDVKNQYSDDIKKGMPMIAGKFANRGIEQYSKKQYPEALNSFEMAIEINPSDTPLIYNCAITAQNAGLNDKSKKYLAQLIYMKYPEPGIYRSLADIYKAEADTNQALLVLESGKAAFPSYSPIIIDELNIYLNRGLSKQVLDKFQDAIKADPQNKTLHFALGTTQDNLGNKAEAEKAYLKALELDPNYFDANYNLGALFYNQGVETFNYTNNLPVSKQKEYEVGKAKFSKEFSSALPYLEKALEQQPSDKNTLLSLKEIYAKTGNLQKSLEMKKRLEGGK